MMGYQPRPNSKRCEGLYEAPVAGETLEFLSFVTGSIKYDLSTDQVLTLEVPDVQPLHATSVDVSARALELGTHYRMDAMVESGKTMDWPLGVVIKPTELQANEVGVLGRITGNGDDIYVPVSVLSNAGSSRRKGGAAVAIFRSTIDIEAIRWRLSTESSRGTGATSSTALANPGGMIRAGQLIRLPISRSPQIQILDVVAKRVDSDEPLLLTLRVFVP